MGCAWPWRPRWAGLWQQIRTHRLALGGDVAFLFQLLADDGVASPRVIDVGSGGRRVTPNCVGLDLRHAPGVDLQGDAAALPIRSCACDAVVATDVLMYVLDPVQVVAEMVRIVRPGGIVF